MPTPPHLSISLRLHKRFPHVLILCVSQLRCGFACRIRDARRQRADACAERAKRRWPTSASSTPNDVLRSAASGSAAHFNSAREVGEGGSGSGSGPSSSSKATSVSVAGSYYFVGGRSILGSGTSGTSGTHNSAMTQPKSLARGSAGGHDDPLANSRKMQGSSADARIASGGGSAVRVRNRNGNGLGSLQEEAAATPAADGGGGDASLEHGSGEGGVGHTVAENSTEDGTFASRASNPLSQKQRRGRDGRRLHVSGGDGRSVLGHAQAAELTRVQGLLVAAHADREDCLRRAENAEAHVAKLRAELDHLRQALATQAPTVHACRHPPPAPASAASARDANDQAGSSRSSRSAHDLGRNEMGHGVGADDGFNASSELPILNSTLQRYVMALRMAIDGVSPPDDDGGQPNLGPTLLDEDMYTEARERAWWGPRGMRNTHLWDSENSVINRATAASRVHLLAASNASREP